MANDKKFIVKNGLLTPQNAVIGSTTDTGEKLQVTGTSKLSGAVEITQSTAATPSLDVTNSGGYLQNSVIANFAGDSDALQITNPGQGDYKITNTQQDNSITFYDGTAGVRISYNGSPRLDISSTGNKFYGLATTNIDGNRILTTADEGPGNGLDADTVDGLEGSQFLRSDVDDTAAGNIIIQQDLTVNQNVQIDGDLTVSGNTTYVDTETILLSDNIITLNANHSGAPTQDAGWEVNRGSSANSGVLWDETNDWFRLNSAGTNLGRIITTADEGPGNGFDADTVDGLEGDQFLRSDVDDTANGNITILGNLIVGDNVGGAEVVFDGAGQDRRIYSENGEIGFLGATFNYAAKSDTAGNWIVDNDVSAGANVFATNNIIAGDNVTANSGYVSAATYVIAGTTVTAGTDVIGQRFVDADNNSYFANPAGSSVFNDLGIDDDLFHNGDTDTKLSFGTNQIALHTGGLSRLGIADTEITATVDFYAPDVYVNDDIVHNGDTDTKVNFTTDTIKLNTGGATRLTANNSGVFVDDLTASGDISAGGDVSGGTGTFTGDVTAPRFVDADNNNYFADPAGDSQFNTVDIDDYVRHRGDTDTYLGFDANDNIVLNTAGVERLEVNGTNITATVDGIFPNLFASRYYDSQNATYYGDFASTSRINDISLVGEIIHDGDADTFIHFNTSDSVEVQTGGAQRLLINNTYVLATNQMRSPIFYDSNDTNYYGDFAATSQMNRIDINDYIRHRGDVNTYLGFDAADSITFVTGGVERLNITDANSTFYQPVIVQGDIQADRFVDRQNTNYYVNPADSSLSATFAGGIRVDAISNYNRWSDNSGNGGIALAGHGDVDGSNSTTFAISGQQTGGYSLVYLNRIDPTSNPAANGNRYIHFYHDGVDGGSIRGDSSGNLYQVLKSGTNWGFWTSGYSEALIVDDNANVMVANSTAPTYTDGGDNTPLVAAIDPAKLHVGGSIYLSGSNNGIIFGRGTASFLRDEELGFGWGSGWYMTDASYLRVRNNTTVYSTGDTQFNRYYSYQNTAYYLDADGDSQLNTVDIDDYVRHRGDTNTYVGFSAADTITLHTNANERVNVNNSRVRVRNKLEVYGSGIELQKQGNGGGVGFTVTDNNAGEGTWSQEGQILFYHADGAISAGSNAAWLYTSSEAITHHVFGTAQGGTVAGGNVIPQVDNSGSLGLTTHRWNALYAVNGTFSGDVTGNNAYFNRYYDRGDNAFYADPASTSIFRNLTLTNNAAPINDYSALNINNGNGTGDIDAPESWISWNFTDANANFTPQVRIGGRAGYNTGSADDLDKEGSGNFIVQTSIGTGGAGAGSLRDTFWVNYLGDTQSLTSSRAPIFYDSNNTAWFADPASESRLNTIKLDGNAVVLKEPTGDYGSLEVDAGGRNGWEGFSIGGRSVFMHDNANRTGIFNDVDNHWFLYADRGASVRLLYNNVEQARTENGYFLANNQIRSPIFYDSNDTAYYVNPNGSSRINTIQALRYYLNHNTTYFLDQASGDYGSVQTGGATNGWSGYAIENWWVFMADGVSNAGIYNDTDNEWAILARRNAEVELYYNGVEEATTASGYFLARNQMRAPIYYDSQNTAYYLDPAAGNTSNALKVAGRIRRDNFQTSGDGNNNKLLEAQDYSHWIWNTATDWGIFWAGNDNPYRSHFSTSNPNEIVFIGNGNLRASIDLDNGNAYFQGTLSAGSFAINGGNEDLGLLKHYGTGLADDTLFDGSEYWDRRVINVLQGSEAINIQTGDYAKSSDSPTASSYVIRTSGYRIWYSDYIAVEPGEEIYGEMAVKYISGSGGLFYYGIERFDKDKRPIAGNTGTTYFVAGGANYTGTSWTTYRGFTTIPTSHTPYNGSDGGGVRFVRIRILMNYNAGGALREFGPPILKRSNTQGRLRTEYDMYAPRYMDSDDANYYLDPNSISYLNDIRPNIMYDRGNTAYYLNPESGFRFKGSNGSAVIQGSWPQLRIAQDDGTPDASINYDAGGAYRKWNVGPGAGGAEGDEFGFAIYAGTRGTYYGTPLRINALTGRVQVGDRDGPRYLLDVAGTGFAETDFRAPIFYDSNNTGYYGNFASTSNLYRLQINNEQAMLGGAPMYFYTSAGNLRGYIRATETNDEHLQIATSGNEDIVFKDGGFGGDWNVIMRGNGDTLFRTQIQTPIMYDRNNTGFYINPNGNSNISTMDFDRIDGPSTSNRDKIRVYDSSSYTIGMQSGITFGGLNDWGMTFQFNNEDDRGFWWGDTSHSTAQGAMSLTTHGHLVVARAIRVGFGESDTSNPQYALDVNGPIYSNSDMYANRYYDRNNTFYYGDFASTNRFNATENYGKVYFYARQADSGGSASYVASGRVYEYLTNTAAEFHSGNDAPITIYFRSGVNAPSDFGYITFDPDYDNSGEQAAMVIGVENDGTGSSDYIRLQGRTWVDSDLVSSDNTEIMRWLYRGSTYGVLNTDYLYHVSDVRSPIFYDSNNTGYYGNFAGTSRMNLIVFNQLETNHGWDIYSDNSEFLTIRSPNSDHGTIYFRDANSTVCGRIYFDDDNHWGLQSREGEWHMYMERNARVYTYYNNTWEERTAPGYMEARGSYRAPLFYDINNTAYYFNGASDNSTRFRGVQPETMAFMALPGHTRSSKEYYAARPRITGDTNYWTGAMGWGRVDMNTVANWGSGFIDSWSNPPNQPAGTSHWVGMQAYHYGNGSARYGWQMVGGPISGLWFRKTWSGFGGWQKIAMYGQNEYAGSFYASIYYDSNNTGYYCDPSGFSNFNSGVRANEFYARNWFRNDNSGEGLYNQSTANHWYSTDRYWKMGNRNSGSGGIQILDNYEGDLRGYIYYDGNGFGLLNNSGNWQVRIFYGNSHMELYRVTYGNDFRAYIYYDRNNTGYYANPASTSLFNENRNNETHFGRDSRSGYGGQYGTYSSYFKRMAYMSFDWNANYDYYFYHGISSTDINGSFTDSMSLNSFNDINLRLDSNNNNGNSYVRIHDNGSGNAQNVAYIGREGGNAIAYFYNRVYGSVFYDHDSSYYANMNTWSRFWGLGTFYLRNNYSVSTNHEYGVAFSNDQSTAYRVYREGGGWGYPYPDLRIAFHTGLKFGANPSYEGMRFYTDYNMASLVWQFNGGSNYSYQYRWNNLTGYHGIYSGINNAHFYPNPNSYGSWRVIGSRNGWGGLQFDNNICLMMNYTEHGFYSTSFGWRLYLNGSVYSRGNVVAYWSDQRLKENITEIKGEGLETIMKLKPSRFNWKKQAEELTGGVIKHGQEEVAVIAQETQEVIPNAVEINMAGKGGKPIYDDDGNELKDYLTVNYDKITPYLIQAIKDLKAEVDDLREELRIEKERNNR